MFSFPMSIPHLVLSSRQTLDGEVSLHTLTPFGRMEILFSASPPENKKCEHLDIYVDADGIAWLLDESMPPSFRNTLVGFVGKIVSLHIRRPVNRACDLNVVFQHEAGDITLRGHLSPYAFASADG